MSISTRVYDYLSDHKVSFDTVEHNPTKNAVGNALAAAIPMTQVAKAVVLEDHEGRYIMALLPASHKINIGKLSDDLCRSLHLAKEGQIYEMFNDCEKGAVPGLGSSYHMDVVVDELLQQQHDVYLEGGDHTTLVHVKHDEFNRLTNGYKHSRFSAQVFH